MNILVALEPGFVYQI